MVVERSIYNDEANYNVFGSRTLEEHCRKLANRKKDAFYKIIFLDIDGVLNGYTFWNVLGWNIISSLKIKRLNRWYMNITDPVGIHKRKVKLLAKIVKKTGAKIVLSSSWRRSLWRRYYYDMTKDQKKLIDLFEKYNIEIIDITPSLNSRDEEILSWMNKRLSRIYNYVIFDDENLDLGYFHNDDRFIQTSSVALGTMITGNGAENSGLRMKHVRRAIRLLGRGNINE